MAINVYAGLQGSGKSYEVVSSVIIPEVNRGRRVVTNVEGIDGEAIKDYCAEKFGTEVAKLGDVIHCRNEDLFAPGFFPVEDVSIRSLVQRGDMVAIDEGWRFWGAAEKISPEHMNFFRMHRHYASPNGQTCDLVVMTQDIADLHRSLKRVVELSFRMKKHKWAGSSKRYVVNMWSGSNQRPGSAESQQQKTYDKEVFPLYQSYAGGAGNETAIDKRQNLLGGAKLKLMGVGVVAMLAVSVWGMWYAIHPRGRASGQSVLAHIPAHPGFAPGGVVPASTVVVPAKVDPSVPPPIPAAYREQWEVSPRHPPPPKLPAFSTTWRLAGFIRVGDVPMEALLADPAGRLRYVDASTFEFHGGRPTLGMVDGERVSGFSGQLLGGSAGSSAPAPIPMPTAPAPSGAGSVLAGAVHPDAAVVPVSSGAPF